MPASRDDDSISQREFIERVADERWVAHTGVHDLEGKARDLALTELGRRLTDLNHAHRDAKQKEATFLSREMFDSYLKEQQAREERLALDRSSYVSREFFDQYVKEQQTQHARVLDQLSVTYSDISSMKGRSAAYTVAIGIFFTVVTIAVSVLGRVI